METENRAGYGHESRPAAASSADCLAGLMFCYNMPEPTPDDCREAEAWAEDWPTADALMCCYNE